MAKRFHELDAVRGLAALQVVGLHFVNLNFSPELATERSHGQQELLTWLAPLYSGHSAVVLFFVLSGFVLGLPYSRGRSEEYFRFFSRRVVRIYFPYLAALALTVAGVAMWHGHLGMGEWGERSWSQPVAWHLVMQHILFVGNYDYRQFNPVFWSLVVEMRVSIIFPVLAWCVLRTRTVYAVGSMVLLAAASRVLASHGMVAFLTEETILYLPAFIMGILMAKHFSALEAWFHRRSSWERATLCFAFVCAYSSVSLAHGSFAAVLLGGGGLLLIAVTSSRASGVLLHKVPQFFGRISYSLYLVHIPVLFSLTHEFHARLTLWAILPIYVASAVLLAVLFHRVVEAPCIRLSRDLTRRPSASRMPASSRTKAGATV